MKRINNFFDETTKCIFASSVVLMILAHGFCFMNIMYSHDSLYFAYKGLGKIKLGRWLYPFLVQRRSIATPWLMGMLSILYVSLAVVLTSKVLELNKMQGVCVGVLFSSNIALTSLFCTYIFDADADCLGLLLACLAVYSFKSFPKIVNIVVSVISISLCLALYQAYICVAIGLFILILIIDAICSESWNDILKVFMRGVEELVTILLGSILYISLMNGAARYYGIKLSTGYNGAGKLSSLKLSDVINDIPVAYEYFRDTFFNITEYNTIFIVRLNLLMIALIVISVAYYLIVHKNFLGSLIIVVPCIFILPLGLNAIRLVSFGTMHQLMIFAFCLIYLVPILLVFHSPEAVLDNQVLMMGIKYTRKAVCAITFAVIVCIGFNNIVYSNGAYTYKKLVYDNTALHAQTIWKDINSIDGYKDGKTQVVFMGDFSKSKVAYNGTVGNRYLHVLHGANNSAITYQGTANEFYSNILGRGLNIAHNDVEIAKNTEYLDMPAYPSNGYCKMIGDKVVVKLQN